MGESTDSSSDSDESIEVQERFDDQLNPDPDTNFGGDNTNLSDPSEAQGFANQQAEANYNIAQNALAQQIAQGEQLGAGLNNVQAYAPNTLDIQEFAREQDYIDANPMSTLADAPNTTGFNVNVGAGDIFNLKDSIRSQVGMGGDPVYNPDGSIGGVVGSSRFAPVTGALPAFMSNLLPDMRVYTGRPELNPFGDPSMGSDDNPDPVTTPTVTNPISGKEQCPDGYVFDNDLQACRLKTRADDVAGTPKDPPDMNAPAFVRNYSLLNTAPSNLPQGFDYNQANQGFMSRFATRPSIFKKPPNLLGFTPFRSS